MHPDIERAVDDLYTAFEVSRPKRIEGCECCVTEAELKTLVNTPLRDLTPAQLTSYSYSALHTVGNRENLVYFWPRLVELSIGEVQLADREIIFRKPVLAEWLEWPERQQSATTAFVKAQLADFGRTKYYRPDLDSWMSAFGLLLGDLSPHLAPLLLDGEESRANLLKLHSWNYRELKKGQLANAFWENSPRATDALIRWFRQPEVEAAIDHAYAVQGLEPEDSAV